MKPTASPAGSSCGRANFGERHHDISTIPELAHLAEEVRTIRKPRVLRRNNEDVAMLVPVGRAKQRTTPAPLVDTSGLPPVPDRTVDELVGVAGTPPTPLSWEEMRAIARDDAVAAMQSPQP